MVRKTFNLLIYNWHDEPTYDYTDKYRIRKPLHNQNEDITITITNEARFESTIEKIKKLLEEAE